MDVSPEQAEPIIDPKKIQGLKYFSSLSDLLARLHDVGTARDKAGNRDLFFDQYVSLILLYFFNPTLTGMRSIQAASWKRSRKSWAARRLRWVRSARRGESSTPSVCNRFWPNWRRG
jgi:hypothetical protein